MKKWGFLKDLKLGDKFVYPLSGNDRPHVRTTILNMAKKHGLKLRSQTIGTGIKFTVIKVEEGFKE